MKAKSIKIMCGCVMAGIAVVLLSTTSAFAVAKPKSPLSDGCVYAWIQGDYVYDLQHIKPFENGVDLKTCNAQKAPVLKKPAYFKYKYLGYAAPYYYVAYTEGHQGYGFEQYGGIDGFKIKGRKVYIHLTPEGTECRFGLADAKVDKTGLTRGFYFTSWDVVNAEYMFGASKSTYGMRKFDVIDSPHLCDGILHVHYPAGSADPDADNFSFEFKPNYDFFDSKSIHYGPEFGKLQACYFKVARPVMKAHKVLDEAQLKALREDFRKQCNPKVYTQGE